MNNMAKIEQLPLYYNSEKRIYYYFGRCNCKYCKEELEDLFVCAWAFDNNFFEIYNCCVGCWEKNKVKQLLTRMKYAEFKIVTSVDSLPKNCIQYLINIPQLSNASELTTIDAVKLKSDFVEDRTKYANRESFEGASIGVMPENKPKIETEEEVTKFLVEHQQARPITQNLLSNQNDN